MTIGTEHEYSINTKKFSPCPVNDEIIRSICGAYRDEILFGDVKLGKELQKTVLEFVPKHPSETIAGLEGQLLRGLEKFFRLYGDTYSLLGLGMHPTLTLDQTSVWDHGEGEYYRVYDRLFNIRQHGWLNIQALQVNLHYGSEKELVGLYNRARALLPFLVAVSAASPLVEGSLRPACDNRLLFYRENQKEIPLICNGIIPDPLRSIADYRKLEDGIFTELRKRDAAVLCEEWVNSSGMIIRFSRQCLEIKAIDEQECIRSDMAVCAFAQSLLRCRNPALPDDRKDLLGLLEEAIRHGTGTLQPELERLFAIAWEHATPDERKYLPVVRDRIGNGSLAEQVRDRIGNGTPIADILKELGACLAANRPFTSSHDH
jgi:hypothetical protein